MVIRYWSVAFFFFFKPKTAYDVRMSDWSSDGCSADLGRQARLARYPGIGVNACSVQSDGRPSAGLQATSAQSSPHSANSSRSRPNASPRPWALSTASLAHHRRTNAASRRSEEHTSELQSLMRISYAVFCLKKKTTKQ